MPTYEFKCDDCGERFDIRALFSEKEKGLNCECPRCGSEDTEQVFGGLIFFVKSGAAALTRPVGAGCLPDCSSCGLARRSGSETH